MDEASGAPFRAVASVAPRMRSSYRSRTSSPPGASVLVTSLTAERQLAETFQVGRSAVREAFRALRPASVTEEPPPILPLPSMAICGTVGCYFV